MNISTSPHSEFSQILKEKDEQIKKLEEDHFQDFETQFNEISLLNLKISEYIDIHNKKISEKNNEIRSMSSIIESLKRKSEKNLQHLKKQNEAQIDEINSVA